jgi:peptidoglycan/LPS O-acetylase OafA/YrhL
MSAPTRPATNADHLRELDGLRAIAIGAVFCFHLYDQQSARRNRSDHGDLLMT